MLFILAIFLPPVAVALCGKKFQALINFFLVFIFALPAIIHALIVVSNHKEKKLKLY